MLNLKCILSVIYEHSLVKFQGKFPIDCVHIVLRLFFDACRVAKNSKIMTLAAVWFSRAFGVNQFNFSSETASTQLPIEQILRFNWPSKTER